MSDYMGKKVNAFLVIMIIVVLLGMGGLSIYYQRTFKNVNTEYDTVFNGLQECKANLTTTSLTLQNVKQSLNSTEGDIRKYDTLYAQKSDELSQVQSNLKTTQANLQKETLFKQQFQKQAEDYYKQIQDLNVNITTLKSQVSSLQFEVSSLSNEVSCLRSTADVNEADDC